MKYRIAAVCLGLAALLSPVLANAEESETTKVKTYVHDSAITTKVKAKLAEEKAKSLLNIKVETDSKGEVELSGTVSSQEEADKAVALTRSVQGVTTIDNQLKIKAEK